MIKNFLNTEGHQNTISASKVTAILLNGWILAIIEASAGSALQPAQQTCILNYKLSSLGFSWPPQALGELVSYAEPAPARQR